LCGFGKSLLRRFPTRRIDDPTKEAAYHGKVFVVEGYVGGKRSRGG
jgi:hypothetical protein